MKRIAVLVRERQGEALRVATGLTLESKRVEVFVLDRRLADAPELAMYVGELRELGVRLATTCAENAGFELLSVAELARQLTGCDLVVTY